MKSKIIEKEREHLNVIRINVVIRVHDSGPTLQGHVPKSIDMSTTGLPNIIQIL